MVELAFLFISLLSLLVFYGIMRKDKGFLYLFVSYQVVFGVIVFAGFFEENPTIFPIMILASFLLAFLILKRVNVRNTSDWSLLSVHLLRIPVELILYVLYLQSSIPRIMTFMGWNFDVIMGLSALLLMIFIWITKNKPSRVFLIIWNILGMLLLAFIVLLAILTSPLPIQQFGFEQPNVALLSFPYYLLPSCIVPLVFVSHLISLKKCQIRNGDDAVKSQN